MRRKDIWRYHTYKVDGGKSKLTKIEISLPAIQTESLSIVRTMMSTHPHTQTGWNKMNDYIESLNWSLITSFWLMDFFSLFSLSISDVLLSFCLQILFVFPPAVPVVNWLQFEMYLCICTIRWTLMFAHLTECPPACSHLEKTFHWIYFTLCCLLLVFDCTCERPVPLAWHSLPFHSIRGVFLLRGWRWMYDDEMNKV